MIKPFVLYLSINFFLQFHFEQSCLVHFRVIYDRQIRFGMQMKQFVRILVLILILANIVLIIVFFAFLWILVEVFQIFCDHWSFLLDLILSDFIVKILESWLYVGLFQSWDDFGCILVFYIVMLRHLVWRIRMYELWRITWG